MYVIIKVKEYMTVTKPCKKLSSVYLWLGGGIGRREGLNQLKINNLQNDSGVNIHYDWFISNNLSNPLGSDARAGSIPARATTNKPPFY